MPHPSKRKGDMGERECAEMFSQLLGCEVKRMLGAGRHQDVGDLHGVPDCTVQVKFVKPGGVLETMRVGLAQLAAQQKHGGTRFAALALKLNRQGWRVVMTPEQFAALLLAATAPGNGGADGVGGQEPHSTT